MKIETKISYITAFIAFLGYVYLRSASGSLTNLHIWIYGVILLCGILLIWLNLQGYQRSTNKLISALLVLLGLFLVGFSVFFFYLYYTYQQLGG